METVNNRPPGQRRHVGLTLSMLTLATLIAGFDPSPASAQDRDRDRGNRGRHEQRWDQNRYRQHHGYVYQYPREYYYAQPPVQYYQPPPPPPVIDFVFPLHIR